MGGELSGVDTGRVCLQQTLWLRGFRDGAKKGWMKGWKNRVYVVVLADVIREEGGVSRCEMQPFRYGDIRHIRSAILLPKLEVVS